jgi:peptide deformylase
MIRPILQKGDPILHRLAHEVPVGDDVLELIEDMWQTMYASKIEAAGLAANQISVLKRVITINAAGLKIAIINPIIVKRSLGKVRSQEGCLSFPGKKVTRTRDKMIVVKGFDENWKPIKLKLRGLAGMCVQHEIDHLNGVTIA